MHVWITILLVAGGALRFGLGAEQPADHAAEAIVMQAPEAPGPMFGPQPGCCGCHWGLCRSGSQNVAAAATPSLSDYEYLKSY